MKIDSSQLPDKIDHMGIGSQSVSTAASGRADSKGAIGLYTGGLKIVIGRLINILRSLNCSPLKKYYSARLLGTPSPINKTPVVSGRGFEGSIICCAILLDEQHLLHVGESSSRYSVRVYSAGKVSGIKGDCLISRFLNLIH